MRVAILSNNSNGFRKIMAQGLKRMFKNINVESDVFYDGIKRLQKVKPSASFFKSCVCRLKFMLFLMKLKKYDCIIVIDSLPNAFLAEKNQYIETIRKFLDIPIVLYQNYYLGTRGDWYISLQNDNTENFGLERYDYYLCSSLNRNEALTGVNHPILEIGLNLDDESLKVENKEKFIALIDFKSKTYKKERELQIQALKETNTKYLTLEGSYSIEEIRRIYKKAGIYFISISESFGIPIAELQACGSYIFAPDKFWVQSHYIKDPYQIGPGKLNSNFIIYNNDLEKLKQKIIKIKQNYNPENIRKEFLKKQPHLFYGNNENIKKFIHKLKNQEITAKSHNHYEILNKYCIISSKNLEQYHKKKDLL